MVYKWKLDGVIPVDAQTAGEELDRIYSETGQIEPKEVVDRSREETAPLHPCFEWNDATAAEKYRENQAANLIRNIAVTVESPTEQEAQQNVRAFVNVQNTYQPMRAVMQDQEKMGELLQTAMRELRAFQVKYRSLEALRPVMDVIERITK